MNIYTVFIIEQSKHNCFLVKSLNDWTICSVYVSLKKVTIPVGRMPLACQLHMLWWPQDVSIGGGGVSGPQVNKFEWISSDGHQVSLAGRGWDQGSGSMSDVQGGCRG